MRKSKCLNILGNVEVEPDHRPDAVRDYVSNEFVNGRLIPGNRDADIRELRSRARKHLSSEGWKFWYVQRHGKRELRYGSPLGRVYGSLQAACKAWMKNDRSGVQPPGSLNTNENYCMINSPAMISSPGTNTKSKCHVYCGGNSSQPEGEAKKSDKASPGILSKGRESCDFCCLEYNKEEYNPNIVVSCRASSSVAIARRTLRRSATENRLDDDDLSVALPTKKTHVRGTRPKSQQDKSVAMTSIEITSGEVQQRKARGSFEEANTSQEPSKPSLLTAITEQLNSGTVLSSISSTCEDGTTPRPVQDLNLEKKNDEDNWHAAYTERTPGRGKRCQTCKNTPPSAPNGRSDVKVKTLKRISTRRLKRTRALDYLSGTSVEGSRAVQRNSRSILSWLIESGVIFASENVRYLSRRDETVMASGKVTHEGIKCNCCSKVFNLSSFEAHAGSGNHRPAAHMFLSDGRSLLECKVEAMHKAGCGGVRFSQCKKMNNDQSQLEADDVCSVCKCGGDLLLCDSCPSAFHFSCIGLRDVPRGNWFCAYCRCVICSQGGDMATVQCSQCERNYHEACLRRRDKLREKGPPPQKWFCSKNCSKIFAGLQKILGKTNVTSAKGVSWSILRSDKEATSTTDGSNIKATTDYCSKLRNALNVLHECFEPIVEPLTKRDLVTDVLFNERSKLNRLNFAGFYTLLLERGNIPISAATVRIYGTKVAEMPLIGTRFQYRRQGMCRLLIEELEKLLGGLGVEKLLLPAAPQLLQTWTASFGFSEMTSCERLELVEYTFLDFYGTTLCHKLLTAGNRVAKRKLSSEVNGELIDMDCDVHSEVIQTGCDMTDIMQPLVTLKVYCRRRVRAKSVT